MDSNPLEDVFDLRNYVDGLASKLIVQEKEIHGKLVDSLFDLMQCIQDNNSSFVTCFVELTKAAEETDAKHEAALKELARLQTLNEQRDKDILMLEVQNAKYSRASTY